MALPVRFTAPDPQREGCGRVRSACDHAGDRRAISEGAPAKNQTAINVSKILDLRVEVDGDVDVRGCLSIDPSVRIGFRSMTCRVHVTVPSGTDRRHLAALRKQAERSCVNLDTLRCGLPIDLGFEMEMTEAIQSESEAT